jgi:transposase
VAARLLEGAADLFSADPSTAEPAIGVTLLNAKIGELTLVGKVGLLPSAKR